MHKKWALLGALWMGLAQAEAPQVLASIKPLHALSSQIMAGVAEPQLLIQQASPHGYRLTPQNLKALSEADLLLWVGEDLESFLPAAFPKMKPGAERLRWSGLPHLRLYKNRSGGLWAEHEHGHEHGHSHEHGEGEHGHHHHGEYDMHLWLSIDHARALLQALAAWLMDKDAEHAPQYAANLERSLKELQQLEAELQADLAPLRQRPYLVFHDAYQYFERDYGLAARGSVRASPEHESTPRQLLALQERLQRDGIICVFKEPQFSSALLDKLLSGQEKIRVGELDPLGVNIPPGAEAYAALLRQLSQQLRRCLLP